jgi:hypothetical protein
MPITGFLEGANEQREADLKASHDALATKLNVVKLMTDTVQLQNDVRTREILNQMFPGGQAAGDPNKMRQAGQAIMGQDPQLGINLIRAANDEDRKNMENMRSAFEMKKEQTSSVDAALGAALDSGDPRVYAQTLDSLNQQKLPLPPGLTGDLAKDMPLLQAYSQGSMTRNQQIERVDKGVDQQIRLQALQEQSDFHRAEMANQMRRLNLDERKETALESWHTAQKELKEKAVAAKRSNTTAKLANQTTALIPLAEVALDSREEIGKLPDNLRKAAALEVAAEVKRMADRNEELPEDADIDSMMQAHIDQMVRDGRLKAGESSFIPFMGTKPSFAPRKGPAAGKPSKGTAPDAAVEFLKAHPELKDQFKAKYGYLPGE